MGIITETRKLKNNVKLLLKWTVSHCWLNISASSFVATFHESFRLKLRLYLRSSDNEMFLFPMVFFKICTFKFCCSLKHRFCALWDDVHRIIISISERKFSTCGLPWRPHGLISLGLLWRLVESASVSLRQHMGTGFSVFTQTVTCYAYHGAFLDNTRKSEKFGGGIRCWNERFPFLKSRLWARLPDPCCW